MTIIIDGTNGISGVDGTVTNPAIEGTDTNTGVYFPAADTVAIATNGTAALTINSAQNTTSAGTVVMSSPYTMRNKIINGAMQIWQRGTSGFTSGYSSDRWLLNGANSASRSTDVPSGFQYSMSFTNSSTTVCGISQRIESFNAVDLASQNVTVSFWFKRTGATGSIQVNLDYATTIDNFSTTANTGATQVSASPATSWTYYTVTFTSLNANVVNGLMVSIFCLNGTNASLGGLITGVQIERGTAATPFEYRNFGQEFTMCQRYYETTYDYGVAPGSSTGGGVQLAYYSANTAMRYGTTYMVPKRATPTVTVYDWAGNSGKISYYNGSWLNNLTPGLVSGTTTFLTIHNYPSSGNEYSAQWALSAEL